MKDFAYAAPTSLEQASRLAASRPDAMFVAGGTTVVDLMKEGVLAPNLLIDLNRLPLRDTVVSGGSIVVGTLVTMSALARHPAIRSRFPMLAEALLAGASGQLRNMATVGGNLLQRTRCPYLRDLSVPCNKRVPGSGCQAIGGIDRFHAVLGTTDRCIAVYPSDAATALTALDAVVVVHRNGRSRRVPLTELHLAPAVAARETILEQGDVITGIVLRDVPEARRASYVKVRDRATYAFGLASAAAGLDLDDDGRTIRSARIALGNIATRPWRATAAEAVLAGAQATRSAYEDAAEAALAGAVAGRRNGYKIGLAKGALVRALETAASRP
ncbi:FAD binding domain-containing protein [Dactylosporangium sucinum]|nr:xanthine dehydrogenase family protein subunit M [Dactylosporangium sucinum]